MNSLITDEMVEKAWVVAVHSDAEVTPKLIRAALEAVAEDIARAAVTEYLNARI